jgi:adenylosuccinate synthase
MNQDIRSAMEIAGWFKSTGVYALFDGQYGSTGKGLLASVIAATIGDSIDIVTTNAGPNSGHTFFHEGEKHVLKQLPCASVKMSMLGLPHTCYLNNGAIINPAVLNGERDKYESSYVFSGSSILIGPHAAVVSEKHLGDDGTNKAAHIASTGTGVGPALMDKIARLPEAVWDSFIEGGSRLTPAVFGHKRTFMEVAQGWSLGINSGMYPHVTSRNCCPTQGLADLGVSASHLRKSIVSLRTYPIRVGNTDKGNSGPHYPDQEEIQFEDIGVDPEFTTVTNRKRRIFTWSWQQYREMLYATAPSALFLNFVNYLESVNREKFIDKMIDIYFEVMGMPPDFVLIGTGPQDHDVEVYYAKSDNPFT